VRMEAKLQCNDVATHFEEVGQDDHRSQSESDEFKIGTFGWKINCKILKERPAA
jgi:hypothetical protein